ncbi:MAG: hypothetical protein KA797_09700 [Chitinophagales bacterium]|nr:hypothetical protein [Chitinophagales bacterium]
MNKHTIKIIVKEITWWLISALIAYMVLSPICTVIDYNFLGFNISLILISVHFFRYILFFNQNILLRKKWTKFVAFVLLIQGIIFVMSRTHYLINLAENQLISDFGNMLSQEEMGMTKTYQLMRYLKEELLLCAVAASVMMACLIGRIIYSLFGFGTEKMKNLLHSHTVLKTSQTN